MAEPGKGLTLIAVTGACGFIGGAIVRHLTEKRQKVLAVTFSDNGPRRLEGLNIESMHLEEFRQQLQQGIGLAGRIDAIVHQSAITDTTTVNAGRLWEANVALPLELLNFCTRTNARFVYASSASVYGNLRPTREDGPFDPLNAYARSKLAFDQLATEWMSSGRVQVAGLRYFNVYGSGEDHKGKMASMVSRIRDTLTRGEPILLFGEAGGFGAGEQRRDFVHVDDVCAVVSWFLRPGGPSGIFNVGTGRSRSFNEVAHCLSVVLQKPLSIEYIPMPDDLIDCYQFCTEADLTLLNNAGCDIRFKPLEEGIQAY